MKIVDLFGLDFKNNMLAFFTLGIIFAPLCAQDLNQATFNSYYKMGQYNKALIALEQLDSKNFTNGQLAYLQGLCFSKLQEFDLAIKSFEKAVSLKNENEDLQYEYGQALYAANELKAARKAFKISALKKFNISASIYYIAHISQMLEEYPEAKINYIEVISNSNTDQKLKQIARFQLGETILLGSKARTIGMNETDVNNVTKFVLPLMNEAIATDKSGLVVPEIEQRIQEILKEFDLDPNLLRNGKKISPKRYNGYFSQKIKFDDNISLTNEENNVSQSKKGSLVSESEIQGKYDLVLKKRVILTPEFRFNFVQHSDQTHSEVYQNDSLSLNANLKNKVEHLINANPASFLIDLEFSKIMKDWNSKHSREAYSDALTLGIGESFNYFHFGDSTFKIKRKNYIGKTTSNSNHTVSISADQIVSLPSKQLIIALFETDFINNYNNSSSNTDTYLFRLDYLIPEIFPKYTLGFGMATTLTNTLLQKSSRGTELMLNPSIDISKNISEKVKISINYDFTKNNSKNSEYDYKKHVIYTEFRFSF
jgi:tetratricopeptide (TPR) repeat protein